MSLSIREKAAMYDDLMKDVTDFVASVENHWQKVEDIKNEDLDLQDSDYSQYKTKQLGSYQGSNFALRLKIDHFKGMLSWFKNQENKPKFKR